MKNIRSSKQTIYLSIAIPFLLYVNCRVHFNRFLFNLISILWNIAFYDPIFLNDESNRSSSLYRDLEKINYFFFVELLLHRRKWDTTKLISAWHWKKSAISNWWIRFRFWSCLRHQRFERWCRWRRLHSNVVHSQLQWELDSCHGVDYKRTETR